MKKTQLTLTLLVSLLYSLGVMANDKIDKLIDADNIKTAEKQLIDKARSSQTKVLDAVIENYKLSASEKTALRRKYNALLNKIIKDLSFNDAIDAVAKKYDSEFTDQELNEIIAFYTSPVGIKFREVSAAANSTAETKMKKLSSVFGDKFKAIQTMLLSEVKLNYTAVK